MHRLVAIIVDSDPHNIQSILSALEEYSLIELAETFRESTKALEYVSCASGKTIDLALINIAVSGPSGLRLNELLHDNRPDILTMLMSGQDGLCRDATNSTADAFLCLPADKAVFLRKIDGLYRMSCRLGGECPCVNPKQKTVTIQMFRTFAISVNGTPVRIRGKSAEILSYIIYKRGLAASREEIETVVWSGREFNRPSDHNTYFNALKRLCDQLDKAGIPELLIRTPETLSINTATISECDFYRWQDENPELRDLSAQNFLSTMDWPLELPEITGGW